ncbi:hypothetical protein L7F22_047807 [Adiantum nelumboides]|nr:hypothetical protein [Adiantum nelumboides]
MPILEVFKAGDVEGLQDELLELVGNVAKVEEAVVAKSLGKLESAFAIAADGQAPSGREKHVLVLANLKPRNMRGVKSNGMLLAASDESHEHIELLVPSEGSVAGERAWFGTDADKQSQKDAATPNQLQKKKIWESVQPELKTSEERVAMYQGKPMRTSKGLVTSKSLRGANVG